MAESALHLAEEVFGPRPLRQWVLSVPYPLRFLFASKPDAIGPVLGIVHRVIAGGLAAQTGVDRAIAQCGAVTLIQRFGSALNLNVHFHMLWLDGVYEPVAARPEKPRLRRARAPPSAQLTHPGRQDRAPGVSASGPPGLARRRRRVRLPVRPRRLQPTPQTARKERLNFLNSSAKHRAAVDAPERFVLRLTALKGRATTPAASARCRCVRAATSKQQPRSERVGRPQATPRSSSQVVRAGQLFLYYCPAHTTNGPLPIENRKASAPSAHRATIVVPASVPTGIAPPLRLAHARIAA